MRRGKLPLAFPGGFGYNGGNAPGPGPGFQEDTDVKQKRPAPAPKAAAMEREEPPVWLVPLQAALFTALLLLAMTVQTGRMSVVLPALALALSIGRGPLRRLREAFSVPAAGFAAFALLMGAAALRSAFGDYAIREFYKFLASAAVGALLLARLDRRHARGLLWGFAGVCAFLGLVSVDAAGHGALFGAFNGAVRALGGDFTSIGEEVWNGRVNGVYNDANITGSIFGLGVLLSLELALTARKLWARLAACLLLGVSALSFLLSMSRGAILAFALAALAFLLAAGRENRLRLLFLMVFTGASALAAAMPAASALAGGSLAADLLLFACGGLVFLLDWAAGERLSALAARHRKAGLAAAGALLVVILVYGVAAVTVTGPAALREDRSMRRVLTLPAGEYTVESEFEGDVSLRALTQSELQLVYSGGTELYNGPLAGAAFTIPEGPDQRTMFLFYLAEGAEGPAEVRAASLSGGTVIPLGHPLLPAFAADRLHEGLFTSVSYLQRVRYLKDGWTLFLQSPLTGHGLGCTEGLLTSVQPYYYESLFLHDHILQVMCETGLLGLAAFLALLLGSLWLLLRRLRQTWGGGGDPLAAVLLSCWMMMNVHGLMEINFSIRAYQCLAWSLLLLPALLYARAPETAEGRAKAAKWGGAAVLACLLGFLAVSAAGVESHRAVEREMAGFSTNSAEAFIEKTRNWIRRDPFVKEQNQLNFVGNAVLMNDPAYEADMRAYAAELRRSGTYSACTGLAQYYYLPQRDWEEVFACIREALAQEASNKDAWNQQLDFCRTTLLPAAGEEDADACLDGVLSIKAYLEAFSQGRMEEIRLTEENQAFLDAAAKAREAGLEGSAALMYLNITGG